MFWSSCFMFVLDIVSLNVIKLWESNRSIPWNFNRTTKKCTFYYVNSIVHSTVSWTFPQFIYFDQSSYSNNCLHHCVSSHVYLSIYIHFCLNPIFSPRRIMREFQCAAMLLWSADVLHGHLHIMQYAETSACAPCRAVSYKHWYANEQKHSNPVLMWSELLEKSVSQTWCLSFTALFCFLTSTGYQSTNHFSLIQHHCV